MVKLITQIENRNLPTISNSFFPNPVWTSTQSFDYQQYYDKKKGIRTFQQARNKATCKPDENFKLDYESKKFYNFKNYSTRNNAAKYYHLIHPYCELDSESPNIITTGNVLFNNTIAVNGIAGRESTTPILPGQSKGLEITTMNQIKGALPFNQCINFKNGFGKTLQYSFRV